VLILKSDGTYLQELNNCDGSSQTVINAKSCIIPLTILRASPFSLSYNDPVNVKVSAINNYGTSDFSEVGDGALIQIVPDPPVELTNKADITSATVIGFDWKNGAESGGAAVIDYTVFYD